MKKIGDTKVGKFLKSKGLNTVLETVGAFVPGVKVFDMIKDAVIGEDSTVQLTPEERQQFLEALNMDLLNYSKEVEDRTDARRRETDQFKAGRKIDFMMIATGLTGLSLFIYIAYVIVYERVSGENQPLFHHFIGIIEGAVISMFAYYYGSSKGSKEKNEIIKNLGGK